MKDPAQNIKCVTHFVQRIIAKSAWGRLIPAAESDESQVPHWQLAYDQLSWGKPQLQAPDGVSNQEEVISYYEFLKEHYRKPGGEQNLAIFQDRLQSFAYAGAPGAKFKHSREKMLKCLSLPKGAKEELNYPAEVAEKILNGQPLWEEPTKNEEENDEEAEQESENKKKELTQEQKYLMEMFGEGKYHLIPSFFRLLIFLKKQKREFSVVFRTYGEDLDRVVWEFNQFCEGKHPCFSGRNGTPMIKFDGSKGTKDLRLTEGVQKGLYYRFSSEFTDTKLLQGTFNRKTNDWDEL